jgi:hypothetical protein
VASAGEAFLKRFLGSVPAVAILACAVVVVLVGGVSFAVTGTSPTPNTYYACATNGYVIPLQIKMNAPPTCGRGQTVVSWNQNGVVGPTGATGPTGANGTNGATGANGVNGATGPSGSNGTNGINGATGPTGPSGTNGTNGATGATGPSGTNGTNGATGATGPSGAIGATGADGSATLPLAVSVGPVQTDLPNLTIADTVSTTMHLASAGKILVQGAADVPWNGSPTISRVWCYARVDSNYSDYFQSVLLDNGATELNPIYLSPELTAGDHTIAMGCFTEHAAGSVTAWLVGTETQ